MGWDGMVKKGAELVMGASSWFFGGGRWKVEGGKWCAHKKWSESERLRRRDWDQDWDQDCSRNGRLQWVGK